MASIAGEQFPNNPSTWTYNVTSIPTGYTLSSVQLPNGWTIQSTGAIVLGAQDFDFNVGIGSGTIVIIYTDGTLFDQGTLDVFCDPRKMGEEIIQDGVIFVPSTETLTPIFCTPDTNCVFGLPVFADPDRPTNFLNNDKTDFYFYGNASVSGIVMVLQKFAVGGGTGWTDIETIIDNTYGNFFSYGKSPDFLGNVFVDDFNKQYTGIFLEWLKVYAVHGKGRFRMKVVQTDIFSIQSTFYSKAEYCLARWNCHNSEGTVKIEFVNEGLRGTMDDNTVQIDYATGWSSEIRLKGIFKSDSYGFNKEFNQYGDADFNAFRPIINEQIPKYKLQVKPVPGWLDWYLSTNVLQADDILMTDFNPKNRHSFVRVPVINDGDLTLINEEYKNPLATVEIKLSYGQNSLRKRLSG